MTDKKKFWIENQYPNDPLIKEGLIDAEELPFEDQIIVLHLIKVLESSYRPYLRKNKIDLFISKSAKPGAKILASEYQNMGVAVISIGLIRSLAVICARLVISNSEDDSSDLFSFFLNREKVTNTSVEFNMSSVLGFELPKDKMSDGDFNDNSWLFLVDKLKGDNLFFFLELLCSSLEFIVLHEASHLILRHEEALKRFKFSQGMMKSLHKQGLMDWEDESPNNYFKLSSRIMRCFEHQADFYALRTMFLVAPYRPVPSFVDGKIWAEHVISDKQSRRHLSFIAAAISFSLISMDEGILSEIEGGVELKEVASGEHPLASIRLQVATMLLTEDLRPIWKRLLIWRAGLFKFNYSQQFGLISFISGYACLSVLKKDWLTAKSLPAQESPEFLGRFLKHQNDIEEKLGKTFESDYHVARKYVRTAMKS